MKNSCQEQTAELSKPVTQVYLQHISCIPGVIVQEALESCKSCFEIMSPKILKSIPKKHANIIWTRTTETC